MKKIILYFSLFFIIILLYTFLFPIKLYQKKSFYNESYFSTDNANNTNKIDGYYFYENKLGYFSIEKGLNKEISFESDQYFQSNLFGYVTYKKIGDTVILFASNGDKIKEIKNYGYPYFPGEYPYFYIIKTNGFGFSAFNFNGDEIIKNNNYTSMITSINYDKNGNTLVSNLDGKTYLYNLKGEILFSTDSEGNDSKIMIAKSNALDNEGQYIAICTGIEPEYIEIFQRKTGTRIFSLKNDFNSKYKIFMQFVQSRLYYESGNALKYFDCINKRQGKIELLGELKEVQFDNFGNIITLTEGNEINYIASYSQNGYRNYYKEIKGSVNNLKVFDANCFYYKMNNKIVKVKTRKSA